MKKQKLYMTEKEVDVLLDAINGNNDDPKVLLGLLEKAAARADVASTITTTNASLEERKAKFQKKSPKVHRNDHIKASIRDEEGNGEIVWLKVQVVKYKGNAKLYKCICENHTSTMTQNLYGKACLVHYDDIIEKGNF